MYFGVKLSITSDFILPYVMSSPVTKVLLGRLKIKFVFAILNIKTRFVLANLASFTIFRMLAGSATLTRLAVVSALEQHCTFRNVENKVADLQLTSMSFVGMYSLLSRMGKGCHNLQGR